jgi:hypothetical protein
MNGPSGFNNDPRYGFNPDQPVQPAQPAGYYDPATGERVSVTPQQPQNQGYYDPNAGGQGYYDPNQQMNQGYYDPNQQNMNQGYYDPNQGGGYNPNNPYYIHGTLGEIPITLQGGEYDNISSDNLAKQRAEWELYTRCKLQNNLTMTCIPIYWLDVNWIVSIKFPNETQASLYIIKQISTDGTFDATQQITLMKFYPFYNYSNSNL